MFSLLELYRRESRYDSNTLVSLIADGDSFHVTFTNGQRLPRSEIITNSRYTRVIEIESIGRNSEGKESISNLACEPFIQVYRVKEIPRASSKPCMYFDVTGEF